ncbi:MAG: ATP-binding protein [Chthoniobacter sp.]|uniref:ATP-binding protein n=1 Tax=Chthoniobacter sp. TaxID=2510640 RepID=UPI0032AE1645
MSETLRILHLEDNDDDAELIERALTTTDWNCNVLYARTGEEFRSAMEGSVFDLVISDSAVAGFDGLAALRFVRERDHSIPFIFVSGDGHGPQIDLWKAAGATDYLPKTRLSELVPVIRRALDAPLPRVEKNRIFISPLADRLVSVIQQLSLARNMEAVMTIVRRAARDLTGADGATFVLREGDQCHYADEDAISPLWKGCRFPMSACISGWVMLNRQPAAIEDIYADPRIPADAYRPTFVKSLVMVPIRTESPIGAIGTYWATPHLATDEEVRMLQALADSTSIAIENVMLYTGLDEAVRARTVEIEAANRDLESFSYSVSHDLRTPLRSIEGFSQLLFTEHAHKLEGSALCYLHRILGSTKRMGQLIEDLLNLASLGRVPLRRTTVDLSALAREIFDELSASSPRTQVKLLIEGQMSAEGDPGLLHIALQNLFSNAWKYTSKRVEARIEFGRVIGGNGECIYHVRDNGAGFDPQFADRLFGVFQRLHPESEFPGTGVGLATVQRVIHRHGGRIWAESAVDQGATFCFTLGEDPARHARA